MEKNLENLLIEIEEIATEMARNENYPAETRQRMFEKLKLLCEFYLDNDSSGRDGIRQYIRSIKGGIKLPALIYVVPGVMYSFINYAADNIDPDGHKWSWKKFWHAAVGAIVGIVATALTGPGGAMAFFSTTWGAAAFGGAVGGAITGGLDGGWKGALMGAALGGVLGGIGGAAASWNNFTGNMILGGMAAGGIGYSAATNSWDSLAGGLTGAVAGGAFVSTEQFKNWNAGRGFRSNAAVIAENKAKVQITVDIVSVEAPMTTQPTELGDFTLRGMLQEAEDINSLIGGVGLGLMLTPAAPVGAGIAAGSGVVGFGLGVADGFATNSPSKIGWAFVERYGGKFAGKFALKAANFSEVKFNWGAARYISAESGRFVTNIYGRASMGLEHATDSLFGSGLKLLNNK